MHDAGRLRLHVQAPRNDRKPKVAVQWQDKLLIKSQAGRAEAPLLCVCVCVYGPMENKHHYRLILHVMRGKTVRFSQSRTHSTNTKYQ